MFYYKLNDNSIIMFKAEFRPATKKTHDEQLENFTDGINTLIIGSSVMERFIWFAKKKFPPNVLVLAKGGDRLEHLLWRLEHTPNSSKIKKIVVQIGTNNMNPKKNNLEYIAGGIKYIIDLLHTKYPNADIKFPALYNRGDILPENVSALNQLIKGHLGNVFIEDFWAGLLDHKVFDQSKYVDHIHLNQQSYNWFYDKLVTML